MIATVRTGPHSTAQGELIRPDMTPAEHVARIIADFDATVIDALKDGSQERWEAEHMAECLLEYQKRLEATP